MKICLASILISLCFTITFAQAENPDASDCSSETEENNKMLAKIFYEKLWF